MTPLEALLALLERVEFNRGATALVSEAELSRWPAEVVRALKAQKLLVRASPAATVVCPGCEQECTMPVYTLPAGNGRAVSFTVCDKRDDINRVPVSADRLRQWRCGMEAVGAFVAQSLGLRAGNQRKADTGLWELGLVMGRKRSQMVCLRIGERLELVAGQNAAPLTELVRIGAQGLSVDAEAIRQLVDVATAGDPRYTPSVARSEARKLKTQALHESWRKEYRALKQRRPDMSDVWYSEQIAKLDIARGKSAETIRKHLKR
ncbi:MAG TPA: hypothetical protein VFJ52_02765 [Terriglobia bacterium]|nr:hypothetical protein [Terriglobia bacterium]